MSGWQYVCRVFVLVGFDEYCDGRASVASTMVVVSYLKKRAHSNRTYDFLRVGVCPYG
jgi:hypothetical protein